MIEKHIHQILKANSRKHAAELRRLGLQVENMPLSRQVLLLDATPQLRGISTILQDQDSDKEDFIFYFNRGATMLIER